MDIFVKIFGKDASEGENLFLFKDIDDEETIPVFKQRVADRVGIPVSQLRLIDDGDWGSLLLESGTVDDISNNLVHLVVMPEDRTWDQFFFFVKPFGQDSKRHLVEADFLETVASVKSRLVTEPWVPCQDEDRIGLVYKWEVLENGMAWDDENADVAVGCTLDLFVRDEGDYNEQEESKGEG